MKATERTDEVRAAALRVAEVLYGEEYPAGYDGEFSAIAYWDGEGWGVSIFTGTSAFDGEICCRLVDADPGIEGTGLDLVQIS